ncbi:MAG: Ger(x)C family spore germination protein [Clostridium lundense]|nr:Ger(x)C family spore germination protein [Clostridium lundense]
MKGIRKWVLAFILLINCILLSGCWSYNEVNDRLIAISVGIDYIEKSEKYRVTIKAINAKPSESGVNIIPEVISVEGDGIFDAIRKSGPLLGKKAFWSHMQTLIISENIASNDMLNTIDFFNRDPEVRQDCTVYIALNKTAEEMIRLEATLQEHMNYNLNDAIKTQRFVGSFPSLDLHEFTVRSIEDTVEPILPIISFYTNGDLAPNLGGSAVFLKGKMIGKLSNNETLFTLLLRDDIINPLLLIPINKEGLEKDIPKATLEIYKSKSKITANIDNEDIKIIINIEIDAGIAELGNPLDFSKLEHTEAVKSLGEEEIKSQIIGTVKRVQRKYKSDIFGFGKAVQMSNPKLWKKVKEEWPDKFSTLPVSINLKLNITNTGKTMKSLGGSE